MQEGIDKRKSRQRCQIISQTKHIVKGYTNSQEHHKALTIYSSKIEALKFDIFSFVYIDREPVIESVTSSTQRSFLFSNYC